MCIHYVYIDEPRQTELEEDVDMAEVGNTNLVIRLMTIPLGLDVEMKCRHKLPGFWFQSQFMSCPSRIKVKLSTKSFSLVRRDLKSCRSNLRTRCCVNSFMSNWCGSMLGVLGYIYRIYRLKSCV